MPFRLLPGASSTMKEPASMGNDDVLQTGLRDGDLKDMLHTSLGMVLMSTLAAAATAARAKSESDAFIAVV